MSKLLNCPFCGNQTGLQICRSTYDSGGGWGQTQIRVVCGECGAQGPPNDQDRATMALDEKKAIAAWNRRPNVRR